VAAVRGVVTSILGMINQGATHIAVATDHVIESFRNDLWAGYKTGAGIEPDLLAQFPLLEETLAAAGIVVWPMIEFEADDALAAGAALAAADPRVDRVVICTPDKDLAQCVRGTRVVQLNRRTRAIRDEAMPPTATLACRDGARNQRLPSSRVLAISNRSRRTGASGA
jgi:5'-3' exonuclease